MQLKFTRVDLLLLLLVLVWGINFTVVKIVLREITPLGFIALRYVFASIALFLILRVTEKDVRLAKRDVLPVMGLGLMGNTIYQALFILGINKTEASSASLILAMAPIFIVLLSALFRHEKVVVYAWLGIALSFLGVVLILQESAGLDVHLGTKSLTGNLLLLGAALCWAFYSVLCVPLLRRYSPLKLISYTITSGTVFFMPLAFNDLARQDWQNVSWPSWLGVLFSSAGALVLGQIAWYYGVQRIGNARTSIYSNLVPVVAMAVARTRLGERITLREGLGAAVVLLGVYLTKFRRDRGGYRMKALTPGQAAPEFTLQGLDGTLHSSQALTPESLLLAVFFKTTCPTCQFTLPFVERLYRQYHPNDRLRIWGISQDTRAETLRFAQEYDLTFPILLDTDEYEVSTQYHLTHVPTIFLIEGNGTIRLTSEGFFKNDWLEISRAVAARLKVKGKSIFLDGDSIPKHRYG